MGGQIGTPGGVAEYTGKSVGAAPGMTAAEANRLPSDPYADEKPLFIITAQNFMQYADKLGEGKVMFRKYPGSFRMAVNPAHRDFRYDESVCRVIAQNAAEAELASDGKSVINGRMGASPFPFPKSGLELLWNAVQPALVYVEHRDTDLAVEYPNGGITWARSWRGR